MAGLLGIEPLRAVAEPTGKEGQAQDKGGIADHRAGDGGLGQGDIALMECQQPDEKLGNIAEGGVQQATDLGADGGWGGRLPQRSLTAQLPRADAERDLLGCPPQYGRGRNGATTRKHENQRPRPTGMVADDPDEAEAGE